MCRRLLFIIVFCSFFATILSIQCYIGIDGECILSSNTQDCGTGETCQCAKYRFQCTEDDQGCTKNEQSSGVEKWVYAIVSENTCQMMKIARHLYKGITCCSTDKCNQPNNVRYLARR
jgi:hypothetical protein